MTILERVKAQVQTSLTDPVLMEMIKKWQEFLYEGANIAPSDKNDETKWPLLYNEMIILLVVREQITTSVNSAASSSSTGKGGLKKIEAGPSTVEWYDNASTVSSMVKSATSTPTSTIEAEICNLASKLGVNFSFCPISVVKVPQVKKRC